MRRLRFQDFQADTRENMPPKKQNYIFRLIIFAIVYFRVGEVFSRVADQLLSFELNFEHRRYFELSSRFRQRAI